MMICDKQLLLVDILAAQGVLLWLDQMTGSETWRLQTFLFVRAKSSWWRVLLKTLSCREPSSVQVVQTLSDGHRRYQ